MTKKDKQKKDLSGAEFTAYPSLFKFHVPVFGLLLLLSISSNSFAQWKKIYSFQYPDVWCLYYLPDESVPMTGFAGIADENFTIGETMKTTDGGYSWTKVNFDLSTPYVTSIAISFKDSLFGWAVGSANARYYKTTDGGKNWSFFTLLTGGDDLYFKPDNDRIYVAGYQGDIEAFDESGSIVVPKIRKNVVTEGISFSSDSFAICTAGLGPKSHFIFSSDGGNTWHESALQDGGCIVPASIPGTKIFFACSLGAYSIGNCVYRSDDGGANWKIIYHYHVPDFTFDSLTGVIREGYDTTLFIQTRAPGSEGIMKSMDGGYHFESMCGPIGFHASRFFVKDSFIYAADTLGNLWLNTSGIGSSSTPQLSISSKLLFQTNACKSRDSVITITFFDSCNGHQAELVSAAISGKSNFSLIAPFNTPRTIHPNDSIVVHYDPLASLSDSATLHLRFHLGWKDFDTSIALSGINLPNPEAQLSLTKLHFPSKCSAPDSLITFSCFDSCSGTQATLDSITLQGSGNFSLLAPKSFPRVIHAQDSLIVRYHPSSFSGDTAILHLHFHLGAKEIDTAIMLYGKRAIYPKTEFSATTLDISAQGCNAFDSVITFSFSDSCSGIQGTLLKASLSDTSDFSLLSPFAFPHSISAKDSLIISYHPRASHKDTAALLLHFQLGDQFFDTIIMLFGGGKIPKENVQFIPSLSANAASAGSIVDLQVKPDKVISGRGLNSISFDLVYNADLLDESSRIFSTSIPGTVITVSNEMPLTPTLSRGEREIHMTITGNDILLNPNTAIADVKFMAMLSDTNSTAITMSDLKLNGGNSDYHDCILSADSANTNFSLIFMCGDSTLYHYLRTKKILEIISIRPNPAQDELQIDLQSAVKQDANIEIRNALGAKVYSAVKNLASGLNSIHLDTKGLAAGMYLVRVGGVGQSLVISR